MKLRFILLTALLATLMARGAVPSYNGTTLVVSPTNLHRSNFLDSATLTWTKDQFGRMTPNVIGGNSSNAQPPNVILTNLSGLLSTNQLVFTNSMAEANTVFVRKDGVDANGLRGRRDKAFLSITNGVTAASAGDWVSVGAGDYDEDSLSKDGVYFRFEPGARVIRTAGSLPIWHDLGIGAVTSIVVGGFFKHSSTTEVAVITNSASALTFDGTLMIWQAQTAVEKAAIKQSAGSLSIDVETLRSDSYDGYWVNGVTERSWIRADLIQADDTAVEFAANWPRWGQAVADVGVIENHVSSGQSRIVQLGDRAYLRVDVIKMRTNSIVTGGPLSTEGGILEAGIIEAATNSLVAPIEGGDSIFNGPVHIRNARIVGPTFGNVPPVNFSFIIDANSPITLENCTLVAGSGSTYSLTGEATSLLHIIGTLTVNKLLEAEVVVIEGAVQQNELTRVQTFEVSRRLSFAPQVSALSADDTSITPTNTWIRLTSDNATAANRTFKFFDLIAAGTYIVLEWADPEGDSGELLDDSANDIFGFNRLEADWRPELYDTIMLYFNGTDFIESGRASAGGGPAASITVQTNDVTLGTQSTLNFRAGSGVTISGSTGAGSNVVTIAATGGAATGNYIWYTNGSGTNTTFFDGLTVDADGMTNNGNYLGGGNITAQGNVISEGETTVGTDLIVGNSARVSGNVSVAGTLSATNIIITNRVIQAIQTTAFNGTNITIDLRLGNVFALPPVTNNVKLWPTNGPGAGFSQQAIIYADMDGTGGYTLYANSVVSETNYTSLVWSNAANAKNTLWLTSDKTGTNFQFLVNPDFRK